MIRLENGATCFFWVMTPFFEWSWRLQEVKIKEPPAKSKKRRQGFRFFSSREPGKCSRPSLLQGSLHYTPEHCNLEMVGNPFILVLKKQHVLNGCQMYRSFEEPYLPDWVSTP